MTKIELLAARCENHRIQFISCFRVDGSSQLLLSVKQSAGNLAAPPFYFPVIGMGRTNQLFIATSRHATPFQINDSGIAICLVICVYVNL